MGVDWDDLFAYHTVRLARIRCWYLGLTHYTAMFAIFCYIFLYNILAKKAYLKDVVPSVSMRMSMRSPESLYLPAR